MRSIRLRAAVLALSLAGTADASDHPLAGDRLVIGTRGFRFVARRDPALDSLPDPRATGAILEVAGAVAGDGAAGPIALDPAHWKPLRGGGYRWLDRRRTTGVAKVVLRPAARTGTLAMTGGGEAWPYKVTQPQEIVDVRFTVGDDIYCAKFNSFARDRAGGVSAHGAPAPADCVPGSRAMCGNGLAEGSEECDDGNSTGGDGCSATCTLESAAAVCAGVPAVSGTALRSVRIAGGLARPTYVTAPPLDPNRLFVVEQPGRIRIVRRGRLAALPYLDIGARLLSGGERGLLSVAFHPDFERNGFFYVNYTRAPDGATVVARYHADPTADTADPASEHVLVTIAQPFPNHNGGLDMIGPDGFLWVGMGDGGSAGDPLNNGQSDGTLLGKLLRVDLATETPAIFAKGLRNPWRFSFDRATGDLWIADVGQDDYEEIDFQRAPLASGVNYGWHLMEGRHCFDPRTGCDQSGLTLPVLEYCHGERRHRAAGPIRAAAPLRAAMSTAAAACPTCGVATSTATSAPHSSAASQA